MSKFFIPAQRVTDAERKRIRENYKVVKDTAEGIVFEDNGKELNEDLKKNALQEINEN